MTAHPSATGVLLSLLEQNQNLSLSIMHRFSSLLFSSFCVGIASAAKWPKLSSDMSGRWGAGGVDIG